MRLSDPTPAAARDMPPQAPGDPRCRVEMLGPLQLVRGDQVITRFARQKAAALLAYLALRPGPHPREHLIDLLWPEMELEAGRDNLSTTLGSLRRQLEPPEVRRGSVLATTNTHIHLNPAAFTTDVAAFERLLREAGQAETPDMRADQLQRAVALWRGVPLPGLYWDWAVRESERLQARALEALTQLAEDQEALGRLPEALESAQRAAALDPYSEDLHVRRIRLYVLTGQSGAARNAHRKFERLLKAEYGAAPSAATRQAISRIWTLARVEIPAAVPAPAEAPPPTRSEPLSEPVPDRSALPTLLSRFFGREEETSELAHLLLPSKATPVGPDLPPDPCRLVTLIGPGGIGKTRLALEFTRQAAERFGFWGGFVSLADLNDPAQIPDQLAAALRLPPDPNADPLERVTAFLRQQARPGMPALLVVDNVEHLLPASQGDLTFTDSTADEPPAITRLVQALLEGAPGLIVLCTSRRRLGLRGERLVSVNLLPVPAEPRAGMGPEALAALAALPSVRLYVDRAQAVRPDFGLTPTNAPAVAALCRQLEGSPLALELAAAWVRLLPPRRMWERLTQGLDIPAGSYADLPARHRSLSAALDWSWRLLTPAAQRLLARLVVFQGGWTLETAEAVCEEPRALDLLAELQEASLVTTSEGEDGEIRYRFLETVRAFARQRLDEQEARETTQRRHAAYFHALAQEADAQLRGPDQVTWLARLEAEHENLRAALEFLLTEPQDETGLEMVTTLVRFWRVRGHWAEWRRWLELALSRTADSHSVAWAKAMNSAGGLAMIQGDYARARTCYEEALARRRRLGERGPVADTLHNLGYLAVLQGDYARAQPFYEEALVIQRELGDQTAIADELHHLGLVAHEQGDLARAQTLYEESLALRRPLGDLRGIAFTVHNLANVAWSRNDYARARALHEENLAQRRLLGDPQGISQSLYNLARALRAQGDYAGAQALYAEAITIQQEIGERAAVVYSLEGLAELSIEMGRPERAAQLLGASDSLLAALEITTGTLAEAHAQYRNAARAAQDESAFAAVYAAGQKMTQEEAVAYALEAPECAANFIPNREDRKFD